MALPLLLLLILAVVGGSDATWCICKPGLSTTVYQAALDYACGNGADCAPIQSSGNCFLPNDIQSHCSYAANSYFQSKGQAAAACDFSGTATVTQTDPSPGGSSCKYPSTSSNTSPTSPGTTPTPTTPGTPLTPTTPGTPLTPTTPGTPLTPTTPGTTLTPTTPGTPLTPTTPTTFTPPGFLSPPALGPSPSGISTGFDGSGSNGKNLVSMTATPIFVSIASSWIFFYGYLHR